MDYKRGMPRLLHDEHRATIALLDRREDLLARGGRGDADLDQPATRKLLTELGKMIEDEVRRHFAFEEAELFTRLAANMFTHTRMIRRQTIGAEARV